MPAELGREHPAPGTRSQAPVEAPPAPASRPRAEPAGDDEILAELVALAREDPSRMLLQFLSLAGAHQYRGLYRLVRRHVRPGADVLDWGAGNGHFSYFLRRTGYRAHGFSLEPFVFEEWLGRRGYRFTRGDPAEPVRLPFADGSFDAVASVGVLEHVRETGGSEAGSLLEIRRVLRPGGVVACYHFPNLASAIDWLASRMPGKHHHVYRYARRDIESLVRAAQLELLEAHRYGLLPRNSLHALLGPLRDSRRAADVWDAADAVLGSLFPALCQNWLFVARRPAA